MRTAMARRRADRTRSQTILKTEGLTEATTRQLKEAKVRATEEFYAILFL